ncbi:hypothetical protein Tco_0858669 [Tanacetum coccineum]|uniref:Uncharacterized protein n=1 Tax=Tanacetum coccineum TaxID=301880 RepID=A0ABQ5BBZ1_9ASTR
MNHCISSKSTSWDQIPTNIATAVICLATNQKYNFSKLIFNAMMRHLDATKKFVMYPRFLKIFLSNQLRNVPVPMDHFPIPVLTKKVLTFMVKKGKHFLENVTPLFDSMLVQPIEDESEVSERPSESQPIPSPTLPSEDQPESQFDPSPRPSSSIPIPDSNPEGSGGNHGGQSSSDKSLSRNEDVLTLQSVYDLCVSLCTQVTAQAAEIKGVKAQIKQLKKRARPIIHHHKAWLRGRKAIKSSKGAPTVHKDPAFDDLDDILDDAMDYQETEDAQNEESTDLQQGTDKQNQGTDRTKESTDKPDESTDKPDEGTDKLDEGIADPKDENSDESVAPTTVFKDDETIAQFLVTMSQNKAKQKGVEIKDVKDTDRSRTTTERSILTLNPLPKIDPKDKGKKVLEEEAESDVDSEGVNEAERKFAQLANDEEMARKVQEQWVAEEEKERLAEEEATKAAFTNKYDLIQARLNADKILAEKLQEEEREKFTIKERAKLLHDTIVVQRRFFAQQRSEAIRNRLPSRTQLRNQMMTYLKHDERIIKDLNKKATGIKKPDSIKEESKEKEGTRKRKLGTRKNMKSRKRRFRQDTSEGNETDSEKENDELRLCLTIALDENKEVDYEILDKKYPIIEWKSIYLGIKPHYDETKDEEEVNLNVVIRSNGQRRYFSTLMRVLSIFDKEDVCTVYQLVMDRYQGEISEGFDIKLQGSSGVHTLMTEAGLVIHLLVEKKYPLKKKVLLQMLKLKLESEEGSTMALELIRFVKKLIAELEPENSDGNEEDL